MNRFIGDAGDFRQPGEPRRVAARDLLDVFGVSDQPQAEQELAV